ncbi:MAG: hypothetical protein ACR2ME_04880 [Acidimicrobiia bacterium]
MTGSRLELAAVGESLKVSQRRVIELLVLAGAFLRELEGNDQAVWLADEIDKAFDAMTAENINAATVIREREKGR